MRITLFGKTIGKYKTERNSSTLKPIEPVSRIEPLKSVNRDTVTFSDEGLLMNSKSIMKKRVNAALEVCNGLIDKYDKLDDLEYKSNIGINHISLVKEFKGRLETFIRLLDSRTSKDGLLDLLEQIELYFYRIDTSLPIIIEEINSRCEIKEEKRTIR